MHLEELIRQALLTNNPALIDKVYKLAKHPLAHFKPRPDNPDLLDEQASFYYDRFDGLACCLSGNGSGKNFVASAKVANFLTSTEPPEKNTPFWVLSKSMDLVTFNCWTQSLSRWISPDWIADTVWWNRAKSLPQTIILKPLNGSKKNYIIEFKSYDQDRERLQGTNIIGFWNDEQIDYEILMECWARTRNWNYPGSKIYTLTPLQPDTKLESIFQQPPPSWKFYRMNTRCNTTLAPNFIKQIEENELAELVETRLTGSFAKYEGMIFANFSLKTHVIPPCKLEKNWLRIRGIDVGWTHATACVWIAKDWQGNYYVYREYNKSKTSVEEHVKEINDDWDGWLVKDNTYADPAGAQVLHEFALRGLQTVGANKEVFNGIAAVQSLLRPASDGKPRLFVFNTCPQLISQIRSYVYDKDTGKPKKESANCLYDLVSALRYALYSHQCNSEINYTAPKIEHKPRKLNF